MQSYYMYKSEDLGFWPTEMPQKIINLSYRPVCFKTEGLVFFPLPGPTEVVQYVFTFIQSKEMLMKSPKMLELL